jgi:hypothetical protein
MQIPLGNTREKITKALRRFRRCGDDEPPVRHDEIDLGPVNELGFDGERPWNP